MNMMNEPKKLMRSTQNKMVAGVCAGFVRYLNVDPTLVRAIYVAMVLLAGFGVLLYLVLWIIMPADHWS